MKRSIWSVVTSSSRCLSVVTFLVADTQLYKRLCPSVRRSVRRSVRHGDRVGKCGNALFCSCPPVRNWYWPRIRPCFLRFCRFSVVNYNEMEPNPRFVISPWIWILNSVSLLNPTEDFRCLIRMTPLTWLMNIMNIMNVIYDRFHSIWL